MSPKFLMASAIALSAWTGTAVWTPTARASATAQQAETSVLAGTWVGQFARTDWTFELRRENGAWAGRYMTARTNNWHDLREVTVNGRSVSFSIESNPTLSFALTADEQGRRLAGSAKIPNGMSIPFSADRRS